MLIKENTEIIKINGYSIKSTVREYQDKSNWGEPIESFVIIIEVLKNGKWYILKTGINTNRKAASTMKRRYLKEAKEQAKIANHNYEKEDLTQDSNEIGTILVKSVIDKEIVDKMWISSTKTVDNSVNNSVDN